MFSVVLKCVIEMQLCFMVAISDPVPLIGGGLLYATLNIIKLTLLFKNVN